MRWICFVIDVLALIKNVTMMYNWYYATDVWPAATAIERVSKSKGSTDVLQIIF